MNREGIVMLWMTQYRILVIISAKERSPVLPDMLSSTYSCTVKGGVDSVKDKISKWKFAEFSSLWDRQYSTEGTFRIYRISIAILLLTQQRNFNQYRNAFYSSFRLLLAGRCIIRYHSIENFSNLCSMGFLFSPFPLLLLASD